MKTKMITLALAFLVTSLFADETAYMTSMTKSIAQVYNAQTTDELQQAVNTFVRIGNAEKTKWEPFYYEAFGYIMMANREDDVAKKDAFLDQAKVAVDKATTIRPNDSEIVALEGFISMIRVTVDPATRGMQYSGAAMQSFSKAVFLNPENPRALALLAQMQLGTAKFFKASPDEACATNVKALEKFAAAKSENPLAPSWGKGMAEGLQSQCK